ncbi:hypothetical protein WZ342_2282 [Enterococcus faecalis]|nr:hypothetical protein WZ342_2282 [Enterococcus faecalis]
MGQSSVTVHFYLLFAWLLGQQFLFVFLAPSSESVDFVEMTGNRQDILE